MSQTAVLEVQSRQILYDSLRDLIADGLTALEQDDAHEHADEWARCKADATHFIREHCYILGASADNESSDWIHFNLWPAQVQALSTVRHAKKSVMLKARQEGFSWLMVGYALWLMMCRPIATVLLLSKRDDEAIELLDFRLKGMYSRLPDWLKRAARASHAPTDAMHEWVLANGSRATAFPTTGGRSRTATFVLVDEADYVPDLTKVLNAVEPTMEESGQLVLVSTADKSQPASKFKKIYQAAKNGQNEYTPLFFGWRSRPSRTEEWYAAKCASTLAETGALDDVYQEYPATDLEAISPNSQDKRIPAQWLRAVYEEVGREEEAEVPSEIADTLPTGLHVYRLPEEGARYVIGADPSEGLPGSDYSPLSVCDRETGEEVAMLDGRYQPDVLAAYCVRIARFYNGAQVLPERNNHGHAFILALRSEDGEEESIRILRGQDHKRGWLTTAKSKADMYITATAYVREGDCLIHSLDTYNELVSISRETLSAPQNQHDDKAVAWVLSQVARGLGATEAAGA